MCNHASKSLTTSGLSTPPANCCPRRASNPCTRNRAATSCSPRLPLFRELIISLLLPPLFLARLLPSVVLARLVTQHVNGPANQPHPCENQHQLNNFVTPHVIFLSCCHCSLASLRH